MRLLIISSVHMQRDESVRRIGGVRYRLSSTASTRKKGRRYNLIIQKIIIFFQIGTMWPCYSLRNVGTITDDVVSSNPVKFGCLLEQNGMATPLYLVGYIGDEPVYKTTSTLATGKQAFYSLKILIN